MTVVIGIAAHGHHRPGCHNKLFTVAMTERAARVIYAGTRHASERNLRMLGRIERCQRNPRARWFARWYDHHQAALNAQRRAAAAEPPGMYGEWAIPGYIVQCESGSRNEAPGADGNTTSASGYYQIEDSTWADYGGLRYGVSSAYLATKTQQDWIAHAIWVGAGSGAWVCA